VQKTLGILQSGVGREPDVQRDGVALTKYLAEFSTPGWQVQSNLRSLSNDTCMLTKQLYEVVADDVDHWLLLSTQHLEFMLKSRAANTTSGSHVSAWIEATGGGYTPWDLRARFGSERLRSVNVVDHGSRGID